MNKIKNILNDVFENKNFKFTFEDEVYDWDGDNDMVRLVPYQINYRLKLNNILGDNNNLIISVDAIVDDILEDNYSIFSEWADTNYYEREWYILSLEEHILDELYDMFPTVSFYIEVYPYDRYEEMKKGEH